MKMRAFVALSLLLAIACPLAARADGTTVGIAITGTHGTHQEAASRIEAPFIPAPVFSISHRRRLFEFVAEGLPPMGPFRVDNGGLGIKDIKLGYGDVSVRLWDPTGHVAVGVGESLYVQRTRYARSATLDQYDASRVTGGRYEIVGQQHLGQTMRFVTSLAVNPRMHAMLTSTFGGAGSVGVYSRPLPETGAQVDAGARIERTNGNGTIAFGVRYINYSARFDDGSLADRNVFTMPFVAFGVKIGR